MRPCRWASDMFPPRNGSGTTMVLRWSWRVIKRLTHPSSRACPAVEQGSIFRILWLGPGSFHHKMSGIFTHMISCQTSCGCRELGGMANAECNLRCNQGCKWTAENGKLYLFIGSAGIFECLGLQMHTMPAGFWEQFLPAAVLPVAFFVRDQVECSGSVAELFWSSWFYDVIIPRRW